MAFVPDFKEDVFISYAHVDDEDPFHDIGWVSRFSRALQVCLARTLDKRKFSMWRDTARLKPNFNYDDEIMERVRNSAVFIAINSPGYVDSEYCQEELSQFVSIAESSGDVLANDNATRIFRIDLEPLREDQCIPKKLEKLQAKRFYSVDDYKQFEKRHRSGDEFEEGIIELAREVGNFLTKMKIEKTSSIIPMPVVDDETKQIDGPVIFLAQGTPDLDEYRTALKENFQQYGITVLERACTDADDKEPDPDSVREEVRKILKSATISVHLFGSQSGDPINGDRQNPSADWLEYREAVRVAADGELGINNPSVDEAETARVIVWTPDYVIANDIADDSQAIKFADMRMGHGEQVEWLQQGFEDLKDFCFSRLDIPLDSAATKDSRDNYVLLQGPPEARYHEHFNNIIKSLENNNCDYQYDFKSNSSGSIDESNYDGLLILYLNSSEEWASNRMKEAVKLVRNRKGLVAAVYDGPPVDKEDLQFGSNLVPVYPSPRLDNDKFTGTVLKDFYDRLAHQTQVN